jgi:hypothetical protein
MENNKITFFTSNLTQEELLDSFLINGGKSKADAIRAGRLIERIRELSKEIKLVDKNYRK